MIYRGQSFLPIVGFGSSPGSPPPPPSVGLTGNTQEGRERELTAHGRGGERGAGGAKSYDDE
jgi:hypothetical protein